MDRRSPSESKIRLTNERQTKCWPNNIRYDLVREDETDSIDLIAASAEFSIVSNYTNNALPLFRFHDNFKLARKELLHDFTYERNREKEMEENRGRIDIFFFLFPFSVLPFFFPPQPRDRWKWRWETVDDEWKIEIKAGSLNYTAHRSSCCGSKMARRVIDVQRIERNVSPRVTPVSSRLLVQSNWTGFHRIPPL